MSLIKRSSAFVAALIAAASLSLATVDPALAQPKADAKPAVSSPGAEKAPPIPLTGELTRKETVENPYGFEALWATGDFVSKGTLIILFIMSMASWYVMVTKLWEQQKILKEAKDAAGKFWEAASVQEGVNVLKETSPFRFIAETGIKASKHHEGKLTQKIDLYTWISMSVQRSVEAIQGELQGGLALLATVGSTAPFVGLFGTVWGIYHALTAIGIAGQASIDKVAGPVGEALIMTAIGLAVAVPAVLGYNWLVRRNKMAMEQVRSFSSDLQSTLISEAPVPMAKAA
jgi:biopolymer transport protein ExbB